MKTKCHYCGKMPQVSSTLRRTYLGAIECIHGVASGVPACRRCTDYIEDVFLEEQAWRQARFLREVAEPGITHREATATITAWVTRQSAQACLDAASRPKYSKSLCYLPLTGHDAIGQGFSCFGSAGIKIKKKNI